MVDQTRMKTNRPGSDVCATPWSQSLARDRLLLALVLVLWTALVGVVFAGANAPAQPPAVADLTLGVSTQGRPITAVRIGDGPRKLVLVGSTHGGPERNTYDLTIELAAYFRTHVDAVPPDVSLYILPSINPDGLVLNTRQNANGVDLNRNMDTSADACPENDWRPRVEGAYGIISHTGGPWSESEVESRLIRDFLFDAAGVVFFHTSGAVVFPACDHTASRQLGQVFAAAADYEFIPRWDRYTITGGMHDWAGGLGIAAITPELTSADAPDTERNLAGVLAILKDAEALLVPPQPRTVAGVPVQPVIWRAWTAWGGARLFGLPFAEPTPLEDGWTQAFERAVFEYRPALSNSTAVVQLRPLGRELFMAQPDRRESEPAGLSAAADREHNIQRVFAEFWEINGGRSVFGPPLSSEERVFDDRGVAVLRQVFERAAFERPVDATGLHDVSLVPLGRVHWAQVDGRTPVSSVRVR
jgi:hypothetical protein